MGKLLFVNGISGAGKDSHDEFITNYFSEKGLKTVFFQEPSTFLRGFIKDYRRLPREQRSAEVETELFATDRKHQLITGIQSHIDADDTVVVMKRNWLDSYVYQTQDGADPQHIIDRNSFFPRPDQTLCFVCEPDIAAQRIVQRAQAGGEDISLDETVEMIARRADGYHELLPQLAGFNPQFVRTDGAYEAVRAQLRSHLDRMMGVPMNKAVFLDKDGTLVDNSGYPDIIPTDDVMYAHTLEGLQSLQAQGYQLHIVSSQPWATRGRMSIAEIDTAFRNVMKAYAAHGVQIDSFSYCPHSRDDGCRCKKPDTELFEEIIAKERIDTTASFYVGDMANDVRAARNLGMTSVLLLTGNGQEHRYMSTPDIIAEDINSFAKHL